MLVSPRGGDATTFELLSQELKRSKWLDPATTDLVFDKYPWLGVRRGEVITAICSLMHPVLAKENALVYSKANIFDTVTKERYIDTAAKIADLFLDRFDPKHPLSDQDLKARRDELAKIIDTDVEDTIASGLFHKMMDVIELTLKTNIYMENRYALGLRLDPAIMGEPLQGEMPYGILFVHGRRFNGYHVRFRDIARGGLRLVTPATPEQYALESARQYDECYGLA
jgi:glutamate dehydrogenase